VAVDGGPVDGNPPDWLFVQIGGKWILVKELPTKQLAETSCAGNPHRIEEALRSVVALSQCNIPQPPAIERAVVSAAVAGVGL
jgi:hypothetical protein